MFIKLVLSFQTRRFMRDQSIFMCYKQLAE
jgi:hypothetical protein